ncbi:Coenzyme F420 hydrogenase/dehydrogenase, beta subunit C-terminal domain [Thomasclavelia saccharogumia]|uniref:Coenzyme F420 hydrogenase/dehydrogenase, beta subunit C-terminal domain n=1 Tax=Thomasclavelia saccharogumia TaxID=341225 RepID=UPI00047C8CEC|nr:Coenzyme F420 hydrogenase/dehydrogenase, beta subunit C-terminal domain [Thomasclavelia saccharogumia]
MLAYIKNKDETKCCGCKSCVQICPTKSLYMQNNKEGFQYPELDVNSCINCNLCEQVCPMENKPKKNSIIDIYAAQHIDDHILKNSSSGGMFRALSNEIIMKYKGYVVGCSWDENNHPVFTMENKIDKLQKMQGSKYLYSDTKQIFKEIKNKLDDEKIVLFTGSPCQCAALLLYLRKDYPNLYTADFLCHGMPSWKLFDTYINSLEKKFNSKIKNIKFRDKDKLGWSHTFSFEYYHNHKTKKKYFIGNTNPYTYAFTNNLINRLACYECQFRGESRYTDITFCDFWGVDDFIKDFEVRKGVSACSVNTDKGQRLIDSIKSTLVLIKTDITKVSIQNKSILNCGKEIIPDLRTQIYSIVDEKGWDYASKKYFTNNQVRLKKIYYKLPRKITNIIKLILRR